MNYYGISLCRHLYRKKLAQFMLREEQVEGFDEQVDGFEKKEESYEEGKGEEEEDDFQPSATVVPSPKPGLRSRTVRRAEPEKEEEEVARLDNQSPPVSIFSKLCELLIFAFKLIVFLIILGAGYLMYTTTVSSKSEVLLKLILYHPSLLMKSCGNLRNNLSLYQEVDDLPFPSAPEKNLF